MAVCLEKRWRVMDLLEPFGQSSREFSVQWGWRMSNSRGKAFTSGHIQMCLHVHVHACTRAHTPTHPYTHTHIHALTIIWDIYIPDDSLFFGRGDWNWVLKDLPGKGAEESHGRRDMGRRTPSAVPHLCLYRSSKGCGYNAVPRRGGARSLRVLRVMSGTGVFCLRSSVSLWKGEKSFICIHPNGHHQLPQSNFPGWPPNQASLSCCFWNVLEHFLFWFALRLLSKWR